MLKRLLAPLVTLLFLVAAVRAEEAKEEDPFGKLTIEEVEKRLADKALFLFDNNPAAVYKDGHLPKAKWVDYKNLAARDLPADKGATLVFYCANEH